MSSFASVVLPNFNMARRRASAALYHEHVVLGFALDVIPDIVEGLKYLFRACHGITPAQNAGPRSLEKLNAILVTRGE